jgi:hypothetical protein
MLFNLVADVLSGFMRKAAELGKVRGVMTHLLPEGLTHIRNADDTILMVDGDDESILHLKFILYCFEWLLGLKINYMKSEVYMFGIDEQEERLVANVLNCQLGQLPMKYLAIPITDGKLGQNAFIGLCEKISNRIPPWKGKHTSSGGTLILTNSCLTSLPTYTQWDSTSCL